MQCMSDTSHHTRIIQFAVHPSRVCFVARIENTCPRERIPFLHKYAATSIQICKIDNDITFHNTLVRINVSINLAMLKFMF